jgi:tungstate transport system substrate-binding protein
MKKRGFLVWMFFLVLAALIGTSPAAIAQNIIKLSTTTSTENSGLLKFLLPAFEARTNSKVQVISVGTGKALELAKNGDVDVTLVHARPSEDKFVADGHGVNRRDVMFNDFIIVGPQQDPAHIKGSKDVIQAMKKIAASKARFISRGDNSGTDQMEKRYWKEAGIQPAGSAYISAGLGMGEVLSMAAEMQAYTLTDRATYAAYRAKTGLIIAVEGDPKMFNPYGIIAVNPAKYKDINYKGAMQLIDWITSTEGQNRIAQFRVDGQQLFFPSARR